MTNSAVPAPSNSTVTINATYPMFGDHSGEKWAGIVIEGWKNQELIVDGRWIKTELDSWGIENVTFEVTTSTNNFKYRELNNDALTTFVNGIVGDSDVTVNHFTINKTL